MKQAIVPTVLITAAALSPCFASSELSPFDWHLRIRRACLDQHNSTRLAQDWRERTGDRSFDSLETCTPAMRAQLAGQRRAFAYWEAGDLDRAGSIYRQTARQLELLGASSEAAFCWYYVGDIAADQGQMEKSFHWLSRALELARRPPATRHYLEALILQSQGYSLWFLGHLQASVRAFGLAQSGWKQLKSRPDLAGSWSTLGIIYAELGDLNQARRNFARGVALLEPAIHPKTRFEIRSNYAYLLSRLGLTQQARSQLEAMRPLGGQDSFNFTLLQFEIEPTEDNRQLVAQLIPVTIRQRVKQEKALGSRGPLGNQIKHLRLALQLASDANLDYQRRKVAEALGERLEIAGRYLQAAELYRQEYQASRRPRLTEFTLPYSKANSPLFKGWIRTLVRLGQTSEAWEQLQQSALERLQRATHLMRDPPEVAEIQDGLDRLAETARIEQDRSDPMQSSQQPLRREFPTGFCIVEMWPDGREVFVWITTAKNRIFRRLQFSDSVGALVRSLLEPLQESQQILPRPPSADFLQRFYQQLWEPIEPFLTSDKILFIGHDLLQQVPIEILMDNRGHYLAAQYDFSYLPSSQLLGQDIQSQAPPVFLQSPDRLSEHGASHESELLRHFEDLKVSMEWQLPSQARWIHLASHFNLQRDFWIGSSFGAEEGRGIGLFHFLRQPFRCNLLSLGVCEAVSSDPLSPYGFGLGELLLSQRVGALLANRWRLDEESVPLFVDFFARAAQGLTMDRALSLAKRNFWRQRVQRQGKTVSGNHPFFWAGISYLGEPGTPLYPEQRRSPGALWLASAVLLGAGMIVAWVMTASRPVKPSAKGSDQVRLAQ